MPEKLPHEASHLVDRFESVTRDAMLKLHRVRMQHNELLRAHRRMRHEYSELQRAQKLDPSEQLRVKLVPLQTTLRQAISRLDYLLSQGAPQDHE